MILIVILFSSIPFLGLIIITAVQRSKSKKLLDKLKDAHLYYLRIKFAQLRTFALSRSGGFPIKAELYFNNDFLLITPNLRGLFNGLYNFNLPVIISDKVDNPVFNGLGVNVIKPDRFGFTTRGELIIKYEAVTSMKYDINIKPLYKSDQPLLETIKDMGFHK